MAKTRKPNVTEKRTKTEYYYDRAVGTRSRLVAYDHSFDEDVAESRRYLSAAKMSGKQGEIDFAQTSLATHLRIAAEANSQAGNFLKSEAQYREAAELFAGTQPRGAKMSVLPKQMSDEEWARAMRTGFRSGVDNNRSLSEAVIYYTRAGDIAKAAELVEPRSYGNLAVRLEENANHAWQAAGKYQGVEKMSLLRDAFNQFRLEEELANRAVSQGAGAGISGARDRASSSIRELQRAMEALAGQI